jgi:myosin heavy subunit
MCDMILMKIHVYWTQTQCRRRKQQQSFNNNLHGKETTVDLLLISNRHLHGMQTQYRRYKQHQSFKKTRTAALCIQRHVVRWLAERRRLQQMEEEAARREFAAVVIQTAWRCHGARVSFLQLRAAAVLAQASWRCYACRRRCAPFTITDKPSIMVGRYLEHSCLTPC